MPTVYQMVDIIKQHIDDKLKVLNALYKIETDVERKEKIRFWINEYYQSQYQLEHLCLTDSITKE